MYKIFQSFLNGNWQVIVLIEIFPYLIFGNYGLSWVKMNCQNILNSLHKDNLNKTETDDSFQIGQFIIDGFSLFYKLDHRCFSFGGLMLFVT